jgi:DNA processing protein
MTEVGFRTSAAPRPLSTYEAAGAGGAAMAPVDLLDLVALTLLPWTWWRHVAERLRAGGSAGDLLGELLAERPHEPGLTPDGCRARASAALDAAARAGLAVVPWSDPAYPPLLATIADPPLVLWVSGCRGALDPPAVAIVGSRAGSPYALAVAERLAADLCACGVVVVSGLARGVDSAAHRGAVGAAGRTVAVLGCGADIVYPGEHRALARELCAAGAIVSELAPGTPPLPHFFPLRNRIISGLSRAVVVIEAGEKSGSLITARLALEQGRDVLAVPGNVLNGRNRGGHALLRDGAKVVETADDILEELTLGQAGAPAGRSGLEAGGDPILACLPPGEACDLDVLSARSGLDVSRLLPRLSALEVHGFIRRAGGGRFVRS